MLKAKIMPSEGYKIKKLKDVQQDYCIQEK